MTGPRDATGRSRVWDVTFAVAAGLALVLMLYLGRTLTFFNDEWLLINTRLEWNLDAFMAPHNGHWILAEALLWKPLLATVGLRSYLPYLLLELVAHLVTAAAIFWWLRREAGGFIAFLVGVVFLFLGTGGEVFFQGLPLNLVGATAAGTWALVLFLADPAPSRRWPVPLLLLLSMAFGGDGLFFLAAVAAVACVSPGRARQAWVIVPAAAAYGMWLLTFGRGVLTGAASGALGDPHQLLEYAQVGLGNAVGSLTGLGADIGLILGVVVVAATVWHLFGKGRVREAAVAGVAGLGSQLVFTALVRDQLGSGQAEAPRYVYISAVFLLVLASGWLRDLPRPATERRIVLPMLLLVAVALAANLHAFFGQAAIFVASADETRAAVTALTRYGGSPAIPADKEATESAGYLAYLPSPARLRSIIDANGSPLHDAILPTPPVPPGVLDRVLLQMVSGSVVIDPAATVPTTTADLPPTNAADATIEPSGACRLVHPAGPTPRVDYDVPGGWSVYLQSESGGKAGVSLSVTGAFPAEPNRSLALTPGLATRVALPDLGAQVHWHVRVIPPPAGTTLVCFSPPGA